MPKHTQSKRKKRLNYALLSKKKLISFIKNLTRRGSRTLRRFRRQGGG